MGLGIDFMVVAGMLVAAFFYRSRLLKPAAQDKVSEITAASIHTIEAAFMRAGSAGLGELARAAEQCGRVLFGSTSAEEIERNLVARGLAFDPATKRKMKRLRYVLLLLVTVVMAVAAGANMQYVVGSLSRKWLLPYALLECCGVVSILVVTHLGTSTSRGRDALAMRRAAYPVGLLQEIDPAEAVALYGGSVRLRRDREQQHASSDSGTCAYVWASATGSSTHAGCASHGGSHSSCSGGSCGSGGCGGH